MLFSRLHSRNGGTNHTSPTLIQTMYSSAYQPFTKGRECAAPVSFSPATCIMKSSVLAYLERRAFEARAKAALMSVLTSPDRDGALRLAFSPIAGAIRFGLAGASIFPERHFGSQTLRLSAASYGCYFASAVFREFKPQLTALSNKMLKLK